MMIHIHTADICDAHPSEVQVAELISTNFWGVASFFGTMAIVRVFEDVVAANDLVSRQ